MRKFMGNFENATQYANTSHDWIIFRYTEALLNFAEAENEYSGATSRSIPGAERPARPRGHEQQGQTGCTASKTV